VPWAKSVSMIWRKKLLTLWPSVGASVALALSLAVLIPRF
jgi:hypothetical protein